MTNFVIVICQNVTNIGHMGRSRIDTPSQNTIAQRLSRERKKQQRRQIYGQDPSGIELDDLTEDAVSGDITPPGLIPSEPRSEPSPATDRVWRDSGASSLEEEQALWVKRRREITELELAKRRGDLISATEAKQQSANRGRRFRSVLDHIPNSLPGHLSPDHRSICEAAIKQAVSTALADL